MTPDDYDRAVRLIKRRDPVMAEVITRIGPCGMAARQRADHFTALLNAITSQQLSTKAAATIFGRLLDLFPDRVPLTASMIGRFAVSA
jgi:3-methyladenine DNA glycosylase/8-oxoguanine DNA glycosylase